MDPGGAARVRENGRLGDRRTEIIGKEGVGGTGEVG